MTKQQQKEKQSIFKKMRLFYPNDEQTNAWFERPNKLFLDGRTPNECIMRNESSKIYNLIKLALDI